MSDTLWYIDPDRLSLEIRNTDLNQRCINSYSKSSKKLFF
jgi:hypothetical protein